MSVYTPGGQFMHIFVQVFGPWQHLRDAPRQSKLMKFV
jgi:hypothetical protein